MTSNDGSWNAASENVIDSLVVQLKRTGRWSRDGRSLRLLNRHWCSALNRRIVEVHPHSSRILRDKDINCLSKFQNLTALDVTLFEGKEKALLPEKCIRLAKTITQLRYLTRLQVGRLFDFVNAEHVRDFPHITSLRFNRDTSGKGWLSTISHLPLVELLGEFEIKNLNTFMSDVRTLKILDRAYAVCSSDADFAEFVVRSKYLHAVSLCCDSEHVAVHVAGLSNFVSLWIYGSDMTEFEPLLELPRAQSLAFRFEDSRVFKDPAFKELVQNLRSLEMTGENENPVKVRLPGDMLQGSTNLERLKLECCDMGKGLIVDLEMRQLMALSLQRCVIPDDFSFIENLKMLENLDIEEHPDHVQFQQLSVGNLQNLKQLRIQFDRSRLSTELLSEIATLINLESLTLGNLFEGESNFRFPVGEFEALGHLPNFSSLALSGPSSKKVIEQFLCVEMLTKLEELSMRMFIAPYDDLAFIRRELKALVTNASHLKLSFSCSSVK